MEFDVWVPKYNISFEFQVDQTFSYINCTFNMFDRIRTTSSPLGIIRDLNLKSKLKTISFILYFVFLSSDVYFNQILNIF